MALLSISSNEANNNRKNNSANSWGFYKKTDFADSSGSFAGQRLRANPLFAPVHKSGFKVGQDASFFTVGSCFAREIERALVRKGFNFLSETNIFDEELPNPLCGSGAPASTYITKYSVFSILNGLRWALDESSPFPEEAFAQCDENAYLDLFSHHTLIPVDLEKSMIRRRKMDRYMVGIKNADVVVLTFGLSEVWKDRDVGLYTNIPPSSNVLEYCPDRYSFHVADYEEMRMALDELHALLSEYCKPEVQVVCTVSPVALIMTFTNEDVVVSSSYTKSLNRVAAEYWSRTYDNVHYFPSYEMAMHSDQSMAWKDDRRHPSPELVSRIIELFSDEYLTAE